MVTTRKGYSTWRIDLESIRKRFKEVSALNTERAKKTFWDRDKESHALKRPDSETVESAISAQNNQGVWVTGIHIRNYEDPKKEGRDIRGINTGVFLKNMRILAGYVDQRQ